MLALNDSENVYFEELAKKYKAYSKPTDVQKLLVAFYDKADKTKEDFKKIKALLKAEKQAQIHFENQQAIEELIKKEKDAERKKLEHKKFTLGGGLLKAVSAGASFNNVRYIDVLRDMFRQGFLTDKEKQLFSEFLQAPAPASPAPQNPPIQPQNNPVGAGSGFGFRG